MDKFDEKLEQRVWQRVRGGGNCDSQPGPAATLQTLALAEQTSAAVYLMLSRMAQGPEKTLLRQLFERERQHSRILRGSSSLQDGLPLSLRPVPPDSERVETALRKCYSRALQTMNHYAAREQDPHYGIIFRQLLHQEQEQCRMIAQILGMSGH